MDDTCRKWVPVLKDLERSPLIVYGDKPCSPKSLGVVPVFHGVLGVSHLEEEVSLKTFGSGSGVSPVFVLPLPLADGRTETWKRLLETPWSSISTSLPKTVS